MEKLTKDLTKKQPLMTGLRRNPDFMMLWAGQTVSSLGSHITYSGLPLLALITLQSTPFQMGLMQAIASAPVLLFSLAAGVWVDRLRRRPVMIAADLSRAVILATIPLAAVLGWLSIWQIYIVIALAGVLNVLFSSAYRAYLPSLVERQNIVEFNARLEMSESAMEIVGPGMTGLLVQTITAPIAILFDALSFLVSAVTLGAIRKPEPLPALAEARLPLLEEARAGLRELLRQPVLRAMAAQEATQSFFGSFYGVLYALYAIRVLQLSPAALGLSIGVGGAGSLVGAFLANRVARRQDLGRALIALHFIGTVFSVPLLLAANFPALGLVLLCLGQSGDVLGTILRINYLSLRQSITPTHLQGRVNSTFELATAGVGPLGALAAGILGQHLSIQGTLLIASVGMSLSGLWLVFSPLRRFAYSK